MGSQVNKVKRSGSVNVIAGLSRLMQDLVERVENANTM